MTSRGPLDLLVTGGVVVDVVHETTRRTNVGIQGGRIAFVDDREEPSRRVFDARGALVVPGFIDGHLHLESSLVSPAQFAAAVAVRGTTTCVCDPHEIANVLGPAGVWAMLTASDSLPVDFFFTAPSCVPATSLETAGGEVSAEDIGELLASPRVVGLGEMMNFPGVLEGDPEVMRKVEVARASGKPLDGHCPGLSGSALRRYITAGIGSDHESTTLAEAEEKLDAGMHLMIREGTAARNLRTLLPAVTDATVDRCLFVSDDRHPDDLLSRGHLDAAIALALAAGMPLPRAVRLVTLNPARYFHLADRGALVPGGRADLAVFGEIGAGPARLTVKNGRIVAGEGEPGVEGESRFPAVARNTVKLPPLSPDALALPSCSRARVIGIEPGQIVTKSLREDAAAAGWPNVGRDLLQLTVIERHGRRGTIGNGLVHGFGLRAGALVSTVAHDSHNLVVVGIEKPVILKAVVELARIGGGFGVVSAGGAFHRLPLPLAGLMSPEPVAAVSRRLAQLRLAAQELGCPLADPFSILSFLALPVIPALKLTDLGLVEFSADGQSFGPVGLAV